MSDYAFLSMDNSSEDLGSLLNSPVLAFDVEATGVNVSTDVPYGFSLAGRENAGYYTTIDDDFFRSLLANSRMCIAHNAKYDRSMMKKTGVVIDNLCDTMIAAHLLEDEELSLKYLSSKYYGIDVVAYKQLPKPFHMMNINEMAKYSIPHSIMALLLWHKLEAKMMKYSLRKVFWNIEMPLVPVLSDMELNGIMVNANVLGELGGRFDQKIAILVEVMDYYSGCKGMNYNSPAQVADLLYNKLGVVRSWKGNTVDARYLKTIKNKHPFINVYLAFKQFKTLKHSYVNSLRKEIVGGRVHCSFNQARTRTSRLSSSGPNLQKIPVRTPEGKLIRTAFTALEGSSLVKADYDQLELKELAHCSQDPGLLDAFNSGRDIHIETAIRAYKDKKKRREAKTLNYKIIFGGGGTKERNMFFTAYPVAGEWISRAIRDAQESLYAYTLGGRRRYIPELLSVSDKRVSHGGREAISTIVQGSAAEEVKKGMVRAWHVLKDTCAKMLLQVHDEVVLEVPDKYIPDVAEVLRTTLSSNELSVPLTVTISVGKNWGEMKKWS